MRSIIGLVVAAALVAGCGEETSDTASAPTTIRHKFGTTEVPADVKRVVTVGFNDQDFARSPSGSSPSGSGSSRPTTRSRRSPRRSPRAATTSTSGCRGRSRRRRPAARSGDRRRASRPSPRSKSSSRRRAKAHPELEGSTFAFASIAAGEVYVYGSQDLRARFFTELGMTSPPAIEKLAGKSFFAQLGAENLGLLDQDVLIAYGSPADVKALPLLERSAVAREDRIIFLDPAGDLANALGFSSPLSLPYAIDELVPQLAERAGSR